MGRSEAAGTVKGDSSSGGSVGAPVSPTTFGLVLVSIDLYCYYLKQVPFVILFCEEKFDAILGILNSSTNQTLDNKA